jgi:alpha-L-arabinofuranosidase
LRRLAIRSIFPHLGNTFLFYGVIVKQKSMWCAAAVTLSMLATVRPGSSWAQANSVQLKVDAAKVENPISHELYAQFVEDFFGDVSGPLWDELIRDRGFEQASDEIGLPRYWDREPDDRNHDPALKFRWDNTVFLPPSEGTEPPAGGHSLMIEVSEKQWDETWPRGISQKQIELRKGIAYPGHLWIRSEDFHGYVTVALKQDEVGGLTYASHDLPVTAASWTKYDFQLDPNVEDRHAKFSILVHGQGRLWLDGVSLMPSDAVAGARAEVFADIRALRPSSIRWPGGNVLQNYHWLRGVGERDGRPEWIDQAWWQERKNSDFGTDEYLALCRRLGTEPSITVNVGGDGATPEEAAAWVEYVNGAADSKYGKLRAKNGHPEPYHVKYWEVGNEIFGKWEIGHTDATEYANNVNRYVNAMRAVDPQITIIACGAEDMHWNRELLRIAGPSIDLIAIHHYYGDAEAQGDMRKILARPEFYGQFYAQLRQAIRELSPNHPIKVTVNEWNVARPLSREESMLSGVYAGLMMNQFERNGDLIHSSAVSDLVNGWMGGIIQSAADGRIYVTPAYLVNRLYNGHLGAERLAATVSLSPSAAGASSSDIDAVVSRSANGKEIIFKIVNRSMTSTELHISVAGTNLGSKGMIATISAPSLEATNTFRQPQSIRESDREIDTETDFTVSLPKASVSVITAPVR